MSVDDVWGGGPPTAIVGANRAVRRGRATAPGVVAVVRDQRSVSLSRAGV